uniref:PAS domain S-box protein n=1 Tax=Gigaspora margarita TaxID=4874 RepID=A0A8H3X038_GIGMA
MNLLSNSIKFTEEGEVIMKILLKSSNDESVKDKKFIKLLIILSDTGIGLNSEFINNWKNDLKLVKINGGEIGVESQLGKGSKFWFTWNVEIVQASYSQKNSKSYINSSKILFDKLTNYSLKRILLVHPFKNIRDAITLCFKDCFDIDSFDTYNEGIKTAKYYKELYNQAPYCMAFINIDENNADEIIKTTLKLREIHNNNLLIIFIVFSNSNGRTLLKKLSKKIGGKIAVIFKPITPKKLLGLYIHNNIEETIINEESLNIFKE